MAGLGGLAARLDEIEARAQRPGTERADEPTAERRAFHDYLRNGRPRTRAAHAHRLKRIPRAAIWPRPNCRRR